MNIPVWVYTIPDGAKFSWTYDFKNDYDNFFLYKGDAFPNAMIVHNAFHEMVNDHYEIESLIDSMQHGSLINGMTMEEWEASTQPPEEDITSLDSIL